MADKEPIIQSHIEWQQIFVNMEQACKQSDDFLQNSWVKEVDEWWEAQPGKVSEPVNLLYSKLLLSSQFLINFVHPFKSSDDNLSNPASILVTYLEVFLNAIEQNPPTQLRSDEAVKGFWSLPLTLWQQQTKCFTEFPESFFGFAEQKEENKDSSEFTLAYQRYLQALQSYQSAYVSMTIAAATDLMHQLQDNESQHHSTQKICTLWIELFEDYYSNFVSNSEYSQLYADVINCWMFLIHQAQQSITPWLAAMNMPNKNDIDSLKAKQNVLLDKIFLLNKQLAACKKSKG